MRHYSVIAHGCMRAHEFNRKPPCKRNRHEIATTQETRTTCWSALSNVKKSVDTERANYHGAHALTNDRRKPFLTK
jgi:hypothetical protein